jgi:glycosyltransferase involved in cell wall biosynthesis
MVSMIMIFHNAEHCIEEAIANIFVQPWPYWELLLVDDGSKDGSTTIARRHAASHQERVRYVAHPGRGNRGIGPSRDLGLANAKGLYVTFLDADDIFLPERLARHVAVLKSNPDVNVVQSRHLVWFSSHDRAQPIDADHHPAPLIEIFNEIIQHPLCFFPMLASDQLVPASWSLTMRRTTALAVGGFEGAELLGSFDDVVFATKFYLSKRVLLLNESLAKDRRHSESSSRRARDRGESVTGTAVPLRWGFLEWMERYLEEQGITDPRVWRAVREQLPARQTVVERRVRGCLAILLPERMYSV